MNEVCKRQLDRQNYVQLEETTKSFVTGSFSGAVGVAVYTPTEVLKCKAQMNKDGATSYRKLVPHILATEGYKGLYRGWFI